MDFIAFDLETTGIDAETDRIVEIGAVRFIDGRPQEGYASLVNPECSIPDEAAKVSGITDIMVKGKPVISELLEPFAEFCGDFPLVAHNARFDYQFMLKVVKQHEAAAPSGIVLDTLALSRRVVPGLPNYRLETVMRHFGIMGSTYHRAEEDATYCGTVFARILENLAKSGHPAGVSDLLELSGVRQPLKFPQFARGPEQLGLF